MTIVWSSVADFWAMGGYGLYVWGSFGVTALVIVGEVWSLRRSPNPSTEQSDSGPGDALADALDSGID